MGKNIGWGSLQRGVAWRAIPPMGRQGRDAVTVAGGGTKVPALWTNAEDLSRSSRRKICSGDPDPSVCGDASANPAWRPQKVIMGPSGTGHARMSSEAARLSPLRSDGGKEGTGHYSFGR